MKQRISPKMLYFGTPVVLVSSLNEDGTTNIAPMSSVWWLGDFAVIGMSGTSKTVQNLLQRPECVLNLADVGMVDAVDRLALTTGSPVFPETKRARGYRHEPDKFAVARLTASRTSPGFPDAVAESQIHLRGQVRTARPIAGEDTPLHTLEIAIVDTRVDTALRVPGHPDYIDPVEWNPLIMKFTEYFGGGHVVASSSLARGWKVPPLSKAAT